jgi:hypothetical protein
LKGHGFSRAEGPLFCNKGTALAGPKQAIERRPGFSPCYGASGRNSSPETFSTHRARFFATTKTSMGRRLLQSERNAGLLIDVLRSLVAEHRFKLHDFVIMPDHVHLCLRLWTE